MNIDLKEVDKRVVEDPQDIFEIIQLIFYKREEVDLTKEHLWAVSLNKARKIVAIELVSMGSKDRTIADPGDVFRIPLYKSASKLILVHNHPSGILKPSDSDMDLTNRLMKAGDILDIEVMDHIIVTERSFFSFQDNGLIEKLEVDTKYALSYIYERKMGKKLNQLKEDVEKAKKKGIQIGRQEGKKEGIEEGIKKGAKEEKIEIAYGLFSFGVDAKIVKESTGLSDYWITRIKNDIERSKLPSKK